MILLTTPIEVEEFLHALALNGFNQSAMGAKITYESAGSLGYVYRVFYFGPAFDE